MGPIWLTDVRLDHSTTGGGFQGLIVVLLLIHHDQIESGRLGYACRVQKQKVLFGP